jgi:NhaA family Na+:H+ antiporter
MMMDDFSQTFRRFVQSEQAAGLLLLLCTILSLTAANSSIAQPYQQIWQSTLAGASIRHWINDGLMAIFFLLIGLELERELYSGELSSVRRALLPIIAALGGAIAPALIHAAFNAGSPTASGFGIPMATDIAFALGVLAVLGTRIPLSLKVFVVAFAVIDDLIAIIVIALFYTEKLSTAYLLAALAVWFALIAINRLGRVMALWPYLIGGVFMWAFMHQSGVHATLAGVLLAFAIPYSARTDDSRSPSHRLEHVLHRPVAWLVLPAFALANTALPLGENWLAHLLSANSLGIAAGLILGKPLGIMLACGLALGTGCCLKPTGLGWGHLLGAGLLGGIGFTMSIFIANLAFASSPDIADSAKLTILLASACAGLSGALWLWALSRYAAQDRAGHIF